MKSPIFETRDGQGKTSSLTRADVRGVRLGDMGTLVMFSIVSLGAFFVIGLSGHHLVLKSIAIGLYFGYFLIIVNRLVMPHFRNAQEVIDSSVRMAASSVNNKKPSHRAKSFSGDSKVIVYCFRTKKRVTRQG